MTRRKILMGAAAVALLASAAAAGPGGPAVAEEPALFPDDRVLGSPDAPITVIEYSSLTCPHCAAFHEDTLPEIKKTWIDGGKVKLVYRHFPLDGLALRAAAVADCLEGERYFGFLDLLFKSQRRWARAKDPVKALGQFAKLAGMSQDRFEACISDESEMNRILERARDGSKTYEVRATPTLIINGRKFEGGRNVEQLEAIFEKIASET